MNLVKTLPDYYADSPPITELERVLGLASGQLLDAKDDTLNQLWTDSATWALDLWEQWTGLPTDRTKPISVRRQRVLAKIRGQGTTTVELIAGIVASFGYLDAQVGIIEHPDEYGFEVVISDLAAAPTEVSGITDAINEVKPAHLGWFFTCVLAQLVDDIHVGAGFWKIRELTLPTMREG